MNTQEKINFAVSKLDAVAIGDKFAYIADETNSWWIVSAEDLTSYVDDFINSDDKAISSDAYSHWCSGTTADEVSPFSEEYELLTGKVACSCYKITNSDDNCGLEHPATDMISVFLMPKHLVSSHDTAGNWGVYPHNGSSKVLISPRCAKELDVSADDIVEE